MKQRHHTLIDVGPGATDRSDNFATHTIIDRANPVNVTGLLDSVQLWFQANATGVKVGVFYLTGTNKYKCRSAATIGSVTAGAARTFTGLNLACVADDVIGVYWATGNIELSATGGSGTERISAADHCVVDDEATYTLNATYAISVYGTGADPVVITTTTLPDGAVDSAYEQTLAATGGATPFTWTVTAGALPDSLSLSSAGVISGTPTVAATFTFTVKCTDSLTVDNSDTQELTIIIAAAAGGGASIRSFAAPTSSPEGLAWDGRVLYMSDYAVARIYELDPVTGASIRYLSIGVSKLTGLAWAGRMLWVESDNSNTIFQVDPASGEIIRSFAAPASDPYGLAWDGRTLWVCDYVTKTVYQVDPASGQVIRSFAAPANNCVGLAWDGRMLYLADSGTDLIYRIDPVTGQVIRSFASPSGSPFGLTWDGRTLWVVDFGTDLIYQVSV